MLKCETLNCDCRVPLEYYFKDGLCEQCNHAGLWHAQANDSAFFHQAAVPADYRDRKRRRSRSPSLSPPVSLAPPRPSPESFNCILPFPLFVVYFLATVITEGRVLGATESARADVGRQVRGDAAITQAGRSGRSSAFSALSLLTLLCFRFFMIAYPFT